MDLGWPCLDTQDPQRPCCLLGPCLPHTPGDLGGSWEDVCFPCCFFTKDPSQEQPVCAYKCVSVCMCVVCVCVSVLKRVHTSEHV